LADIDSDLAWLLEIWAVMDGSQSNTVAERFSRRRGALALDLPEKATLAAAVARARRAWPSISGTTDFGGTCSNGTGIHLYDSDYCTVTGNTITKNAGGGVWLVGTAATDVHNTITPNAFSGNGGADYPSPTY
jgi:parallel beta-helix repeat protein